MYGQVKVSAVMSPRAPYIYIYMRIMRIIARDSAARVSKRTKRRQELQQQQSYILSTNAFNRQMHLRAMIDTYAAI